MKVGLRIKVNFQLSGKYFGMWHLFQSVNWIKTMKEFINQQQDSQFILSNGEQMAVDNQLRYVMQRNTGRMTRMAVNKLDTYCKKKNCEF